MKIVQVITTLVFGGAERLLVNFCNLHVQDHEVHVIYLKGEARVKPMFDPRITVHHVPLGLSSARNLRKILKALKPDVIHTHLGHADLIGMWASRGLPATKVCTMHNVYFKWNWKDDLFHMAYYLSFHTFAKTFKVSCISAAVARHVKGKLAVPADRVRVIYNCVPDLAIVQSKSSARHDLKLNESEFCVLSIGRLSVQKSIGTLLRAVPLLRERIPALRILLVGEGKEEANLRALSAQLGVNDVVDFRGTSPVPEKYQAAADVFVLSSVFEGLPTVIIEAFRSSTPVITSNVDGSNELVQDRVNGLLFPAEDHAALADRIAELYQNDDLRKKLAFEGNESYKNRYNITKYARETIELYSE